MRGGEREGRPGSHAEGAENVLALRCIQASRRIDQFPMHCVNQHAALNETPALSV